MSSSWRWRAGRSPLARFALPLRAGAPGLLSAHEPAKAPEDRRVRAGATGGQGFLVLTQRRRPAGRINPAVRRTTDPGLHPEWTSPRDRGGPGPASGYSGADTVGAVHSAARTTRKGAERRGPGGDHRHRLPPATHH